MSEDAAQDARTEMREHVYAYCYGSLEGATRVLLDALEKLDGLYVVEHTPETKERIDRAANALKEVRRTLDRNKNLLEGKKP